MFINRFNRFIRAEEGGQGSGEGGGGGDANTPAPLINTDGTFAENWHSQLGDEFAPHAAQLGTYKDVKGLAKSLLHFRATGPSYPGEDSQPEDITRFHALAKVPVEGTATAYGLKIPEGATDKEKAVFEGVAKIAHENHIPGPALSKLIEWYQGIQQDQLQELNDQIASDRKAREDELIGEWRGNYEGNKSTVRHIATKLAEQAGVPGDHPAFAAMVDNPIFAKMMLQVSKLTSEDGIRPPGGLGDLRSPQQKADSIMDGSDPVWGKKYTEGSSDEKVAAYNEVKRLLGDAAK